MNEYQCPRCGGEMEESVSWSNGRKVGRVVRCSACDYQAVRPVERTVSVASGQRRLEI